MSIIINNLIFSAVAFVTTVTLLHSWEQWRKQCRK